MNHLKSTFILFCFYFSSQGKKTDNKGKDKLPPVGKTGQQKKKEEEKKGDKKKEQSKREDKKKGEDTSQKDVDELYQAVQGDKCFK